MPLLATSAFVPEDIPIFGLDDIRPGRTSIPPLTSVSQPHRDKSRTTAGMLFALLRGEAVQPKVTLPAELLVRGSTTAPSRRT